MKFNGERMKLLLRQNNISYDHVAEELHTSYAYFCNMINAGKTSPQRLKNIAHMLGVDVYKLTEEDELLPMKMQSIKTSLEELCREKDERLKEKDERLKEKDERLKEKDERLKEKDRTIELLYEKINLIALSNKIIKQD